MDLEIITSSFPLLLAGAGVTIEITALSVGLAWPSELSFPSQRLKIAMDETMAGEGGFHDGVEDMLKDIKQDDLQGRR